MPRTLSKTVMGIAATCCVAEPALACGPSGPVEVALLLGILALAAALPVALASAGLVSAFRARRDGFSFGKGFVGLVALACEAGVVRLAGTGNLVGLLAAGAGAVQVALFVMAAVNGPSQAPLPGRLTILSQQALGF